MNHCKRICCFDKAVDAYGMICTALPALLSGTTLLVVTQVQTLSSQIGALCVNQTNTTTCMQIAQEISGDMRIATLFAGAAAGLSLVGAIAWAAMRVEVVSKKKNESELVSN